MSISHEGTAEKIGIEYSVIHSEKHNTTCEGLLMGIFHPAIGQAKNMKLAASALISNREESDFL
jgi:hypothetical protein